MSRRDDVWELIHLINRKMESAAASGDMGTVILTSGDLPEVVQLDAILAEGDADIDVSLTAVAQHLLGRLRWYRSRLVPEGQGHADYDAALDLFELPFVMGLDDIPEPMLPTLAERMVPMAGSFQQGASETKDPARIESSLVLSRQIVTHLDPDHPFRPGMMANLGLMLLLRFENGGSAEDLDQSIDLLETALSRAVDQREAILSTLVQALRRRLAATADPADLDRVIECCEAGGAVASVDNDHAVKWLSSLGDSLLNRFERAGAGSDLDRAIDVMRRTLDADRARLLDPVAVKYDLAYALSRRFDRARSMTDLTEAIDVARSAVEAAGPDHVFRAPTQDLLDAMLRANASLRSAP
ncbi:hypothetical protein ABZZ17_34090 [Streptomyces sp. NPDC006512]|uniref:hypothetical protein n=1 Tax=Streptomyces sp. NPDC006512 TaxID=3154307 RepID=UPI0033AEA694